MNVKEAKELLNDASVVFGFSDKQMELLSGIKNIEILKSCFRMLINGLSISTVAEIIARAQTPEVCNSLANEKMAEKYADYDAALKKCEEAGEQADKLKGYNDQIIKLLETDVMEAHKEQINSLKDVINSLKNNLASQADAISTWQERYNEKKELCEKLDAENAELQVSYAALEIEKNKALRYSGEATEPEPKLVAKPEPVKQLPEPKKKKSLFKKKNKYRDNVDEKIVVQKLLREKVLHGKVFSQEQRDYLVIAVTEGVSLDTFEYICDPEVSVGNMKLLKEYYDRDKE